MQIAAMLTMLIDHIGLIFFPDNAVWRIIGRIALPIYAYCIVQGFLHTRSEKRYMNRLLILAAISQIPYMLSFSTLNINVIATLAVCLGVLIAASRYPDWLIGFVAAGSFVLEALPFSYGYYALALVLIYRYLDRRYWLPAHLVLNLFALVINDWWVQLFSIVPTVFLAYRDTLFAEFKLGVVPPRWVWRSFYPAHLAALAAIAALLNIE